MKQNLKVVIEVAKELDAGLADEGVFKKVIFDYISEDETIIPNMLELLKRERHINKELLQDTNLELSRVHSTFDMEKNWKDSTPKERKENEKHKQWIYNQVVIHYHKWKDRIGHCFMNFSSMEKKYAELPAEDKKIEWL